MKSPRAAADSRANSAPNSPGNPDEAVQHKWKVLDTKGSGDCMFRAVAAARAYTKNNKELTEEEARLAAAELRMAVVSHANKHTSRLAEWFAPDTEETSSQRGDQNMPSNIDQWIQNMSHANTWGDGLAIHCIAERIGVAITVWKKNKENIWVRYAFAPKFSQGVAELRNSEKPLSVVLDKNHYTALIPPKDQKYPKPWLLKTTANHATILIDLTGGGKSKRSTDTPSAGSIQTYSTKPPGGQQHTPRSCSIATFFTRKPQATSNKQAAAASSLESASCRGSHVSLTAGATPRCVTPHNNIQDAAAAAHSNIDSMLHSTQDTTDAPQLSHTPGSHSTLTASNLDILNKQPPNSHKAAPSFTDKATRKLEWSKKNMHRHLWTCPICQENIEVRGHNAGQYYRKKHLELVHNESLAKYPLPGRQNNTHRAMLRAKQLPNVGSTHEVVSINGKGLQDLVSKTTWICRICLAKGTTAKIATSACDTTRIPFLRLKWWSQLDSAQKQKLANNLSLSNSLINTFDEKAAEALKFQNPTKDPRPAMLITEKC